MDFDARLGIYPLENYAQWTQMVDYVTEEVIDRIQPVNKVILSEEREREFRKQEDSQSAAAESESNPEAEETGQAKEAAAADANLEETLDDLRKEVAREEKRQEKAMRHKYKYKEAFGAIFYSDVPNKAKALTGIDGAARTHMNLDKTITL
mmetsp:Transcript_15147/g.20552  ORF Transcript_15147/g.20552 Transcript_15147/m.20552 type:complete len:151 (+) Transcript_15147:283-735(+)|eukprot:CAMPEP_0185597744 /NCGR_PEP_ID=MMETSP0434-20130131/81563_1 /TAXON_ID=626734 ORGANISM="Favella taraikaensis, Strain Fe Narragansett Bay" /NCGR_SAMPLE_ID=MMETSP0434 /ASSEMBLY_ACC=CAM_ASM_000379 /LENGTH=150 /DNA_ID=CAMNT_0028226551 /DNA_START=260 /DNA_END=712 /DNA_ORIENTATION=-